MPIYYIYIWAKPDELAMFNYINFTLMKTTKSLLTLTAVLAFTYGAGWLLFNAFQNLGLTTGPVGFPEAVGYVIRFALGIPVTIAQLAAIKYAKDLTKSLN